MGKNDKCLILIIITLVAFLMHSLGLHPKSVCTVSNGFRVLSMVIPDDSLFESSIRGSCFTFLPEFVA